ncbi:MAG: methyltransferase domain-containing protein [Gammaproteobacteria bacterium]|nr:methyltransferase domain-containing protein [Gammaproteobacteria bacterium]
MLETIYQCPNCGNNTLESIYELDRIPVHSVNLITDREQALAYPTGSMNLGFCSYCTFISNAAFDPERMQYASDYEETQGYSSSFRDFHQSLAEDLVNRLDLHDKTVLEIGCGKGEFLELLVEAGAGRVIGFDPAWIPARMRSGDQERISVIAENYSSKHAGLVADMYCCKMTLEHIPDTREFVRMLRQSIGARENVTVFFQVPDAERILNGQAFQDIYYEHCSYFTHASLEYLFESNGFHVTRMNKVYDDQYLTLEAVPVSNEAGFRVSVEDVAVMTRQVNVFVRKIHQMQTSWREYLCEQANREKQVVLWGGGSKAVAFLTTMHIEDEINYVIDINPHKQGCFLPKTGHSVFGPDELRQSPADIIIVMNSAYMSEIQDLLQDMDIKASLISMESHSPALVL